MPPPLLRLVGGEIGLRDGEPGACERQDLRGAHALARRRHAQRLFAVALVRASEQAAEYRGGLHRRLVAELRAQLAGAVPVPVLREQEGAVA